MIRLVQSKYKAQYSDEVDQMHRLRASVFSGRLGWDVQVVDGWEIDPFDALDPLYLISLDNLGHVRGTLRLLPTTGPNMLRNVFHCLLPDGLVIESPRIWESSRFSVDLSLPAERSANRLNRVTGELLAGIVEVGMLAGLTHVVSVYDARMARVLKQAGCPADLVGEPRRIGEVMTYAGLFDTDEAMLGRIRAAAGLEGSVLEPETRELAFAA